MLMLQASGLLLPGVMMSALTRSLPRCLACGCCRAFRLLLHVLPVRDLFLSLLVLCLRATVLALCLVHCTAANIPAYYSLHFEIECSVDAVH
jgi:hypothetical protein